jgi:hypothetical protein
VSGQLRAPVALIAGKNPWYTLDTGLDGLEIRSGWYGDVSVLYDIDIRTPTPRPSSSYLWAVRVF